jgi:hypothetical protein
MQQKRKRSLSLLTLAGLCSFVPLYWIGTSPDSKSNGNIDQLLALAVILAGPGGFFGLAVAAYFVLWERFWQLSRIIAFVIFCDISFWASTVVALPLIPLFGGNLPGPFKGPMSLSLPFLFAAGYLGAFLVMVSGRFAFSEQPMKVGSAFLLSLGGGFAALVGGLIDPSIVDAAGSTKLEGMSPLATWPPARALFLGLLLNQTESGFEPEPPTPEDSDTPRQDPGESRSVP